MASLADGSSSEYAEEHDYNRNLVSTLRQAETEGQIAIQDDSPGGLRDQPGQLHHCDPVDLGARLGRRWRSRHVTSRAP